MILYKFYFQVEGERLLLEASHKRAAALTEIQALKTEGGIGADPRIEANPEHNFIQTDVLVK